MALVGPGYLADNVEHGAALTTRVKETLNLVRQLDVASRLLTFRIDELSGQLNRHIFKPGAATDGHVDRSEEDSRRENGDCGSGKKRARASGGHAHADDGACVNTKQNKRRKAAALDTSRKDDGVAATRVGRKHGDRAQLERLKRAALRCADEKVALAAHLYELLDLQIRYIDSDLRRFEKHYGFIPPFVPPPPAAPLSRRRFDHLTKEREPSQMSASGSDDVSTNGGGIHPNEPTYCFCRQVAFGEMIACDNLNCEIEWFHYGCVGLTKPPGTWVCRNCKKTLRPKSLGGGSGLEQLLIATAV